MKKKFYDSKTRLLLDFHIPEWDEEILSKFDVKELIEKCEKSSVDCIYFYAKDHYGHCYYNSKIGHKHKNMGKRDFLKEFINQAKKKGFLVGVYYSVNWQVNVNDSSFWAKDINGKYALFGTEGVKRWPQICYNSKGYLDFCMAQLEEIMANYEMDAIWIDMLNYQYITMVCFCDKCKRRFKELYGHDDLPLKPSWDRVWRDFLDFRFNANYEFATKLTDKIKKLNPEIVVAYNFHAAPRENWLEGEKPVMHSSYSDYSVGQIMPFMYGAMYPRYIPKYLRCLQQGKPVEALTFRFNQFHDYTTKPKAQFIWEIMSAAANGASVTTVDQPFHTGELDENTYETIGEGYRFLKSRKNLYKGEDIKFICLYFSQKSRDYYARNNKEAFLLPFNGAIKMLVEEHYPIDILFDENIVSDNLNGYEVLILPNVAILDEVEIEKIKGFIKNGGILIASDETSLYDKNGDRLDNYRLAELFGVDYRGKNKFSHNFFKVPKEYSDGIGDNYSILIDGPGNLVRVNNKDTQVSGTLEIPFYEASDAMFFSHNIHPPWKGVGPSLIFNKYQKGKVFFLPFKIFRSYANKYTIPEHRKFIRNIIESLNIELPIKISCPLNVDTIIKEDSYNYYIHLIGYNPTNQICTFTANPEKPIITPLMMEEPLIYKAEIKINAPFKDYEIEGKSKILEEKQNNIKILIEDIYESIKVTKK